MALVAALFIANALLARQGERGLSVYWLTSLLLPGALAAHLSVTKGTRNAESWAGEGALAGVLAANVAASVWVVWLAVATATTDWEQYARQVGPEIAYAVRDAALPATVALAALAVALAYAGCAVAGWLGAALYTLLREVASRGKG
jgi:hypothetical protein